VASTSYFSKYGVLFRLRGPPLLEGGMELFPPTNRFNYFFPDPPEMQIGMIPSLPSGRKNILFFSITASFFHERDALFSSFLMRGAEPLSWKCYG